MLIVDLCDVTAGMAGLVGGKAAGLGELLRAGERVPAGFCVTTEARELPRAEILDAYARLGGGAVAVRSSATVEDGPDASFAGMFATVLDVRGPEALLAAVETCWESAGSARVSAYGVGSDDVRMGVVVQRMVEAETAGVLFTANPVTGRRTEMLVESAAGGGAAVVDGGTAVDRRVLEPGDPLHEAGERLQALFGSPQDVEWAVDKRGELWILQSRPITTLFPLPPGDDEPPRVYLEFGHVQGMLRPATPMGMSTLQELVKAMLAPLGLQVEVTDIGGRLYGDMTDLVRDPAARKRLVALMAVDFGPRAQAVMRHVLDDPRFTPRKMPRTRRAMPPVGRALKGVLGALARPDSARARLNAEVDRIRLSSTRDDGRAMTTAERLRLVREHDEEHSPDAIIWPIVAGMLASALPPRLLAGLVRPDEIHAVLGGMPHNVTIEMDLALWRLAQRSRDVPVEDIDLKDFLDAYGHRGAAEVDLGVPRWAEDPAPVRAALANLMRVTDPEQAPDRRFARAAESAEAALREIGDRVRWRRPVRGRLALFLLGRARRLAGLRESGKFAGLFHLAEMRRHLLAAGADLTATGVLDRPDDIMFLTAEEAERLAAGEGRHRELIAGRRALHARESRRRSVPVALLSDGTDVEATLPAPDDPTALRGVGASAGRATGPVRVVHDPATAHLEPGEVLVTATTDPGWTPLFLTAAALVTETGAVMAHGPTVAREYGLPAVICVPGATRRLRTGQIVTVDAAAGTVTVHAAAGTVDAATGTVHAAAGTVSVDAAAGTGTVERG